MSEHDLDQLERDVEAARAKLAGDLATLRSPDTLAEFTDDLKSEALAVKDSLIERAKASAQSAVRNVVDDLAAKAAANPVAALAIGAGLAWRLIQRPPIATALVGAGLISLLRTGATPQTSFYDDVRDRVRDLGANGAGPTLASVAGEIAESATEKSQEWRGQAQEAVSVLKDRAVHYTADALNDAQQATADMAARTAAVAGRASAVVRDTFRDEDVRDNVMLGAAALAVAAAMGIAYQRRAE